MQVALQEACQPVLRDLPDELWAMVLQFLMKVDIKSARLVCKRFDPLAIPLLYDVVIVAPHRKDLAVFDAIAGHKGLQQIRKGAGLQRSRVRGLRSGSIRG